MLTKVNMDISFQWHIYTLMYIHICIKSSLSLLSAFACRCVCVYVCAGVDCLNICKRIYKSSLSLAASFQHVYFQPPLSHSVLSPHIIQPCMYEWSFGQLWALLLLWSSFSGKALRSTRKYRYKHHVRNSQIHKRIPESQIICSWS